MTATLEATGRAPDDAPPTSTDPDDAGAPPRTPRPVAVALQPWRDPDPARGWLLTALVTAVAIVTRFWGVGFPHTKIFDEAYYATEAQEITRFGYEDNRGYMFIVHPPLGKWLIGWSSELFGGSNPGTDSFGWRVAPVVAGILVVVLVARTARRMFRSNLFGAVAGLLVALDGMSLVLSRTALLDIFLELFVFAGFAALVVDRDKMRERLGRLVADGALLTHGAPTLGPRPWRVVAGVMFGLACAVKWNATVFFVLFCLLSLVWDRGALRAAGVARSWRNAGRRSALPSLGSYIVVPVVTYLLCNLGWFVGENGWHRHWADTHPASARLNIFGLRIPFSWGWVPGPIRSLGDYTLNAYRFHEGLDSPHPYGSKPWSWLVLGRPTDFYYDASSKACGASSCSRQILLIGTPLMWWAFIPMLLWLGWHWFSTRDWRAASIWVAFLAGWVFWFQDLKRTMFLFYMAPLVPFLVIGLTLGLGVMLGSGVRRTGDVWRDLRASRRRMWGLAGSSVFLGLVVADFVWMWPIFTAGLLTYDTGTASWHAHMWLPSWI